MTRMEKYKTLREQIAKDIKANTEIWVQEQKLENYRLQLIKVDKSYFAPIFETLHQDLNLINFENSFIKNDDQNLKTNDKLLLTKMLANINNVLAQYSEKNIKPAPIDTVLESNNLQYKTIINSMNDKMVEFQKKLASKINEVQIFINSLEQKYQNIKLAPTAVNEKLNQINIDHQNFEEQLQQIKTKINYKVSLVIFTIIISCLVVCVGLVLVLLLVK